MKPKLIRDLLADRIPLEALSRVGSVREHQDLLARKVGEELGEIVDSEYLDIREYADTLEAIMALAEVSGVSWVDVEKERLAKAAERGGFLGGVVYHEERDPTAGARG